MGAVPEAASLAGLFAPTGGTVALASRGAARAVPGLAREAADAAPGVMRNPLTAAASGVGTSMLATKGVGAEEPEEVRLRDIDSQITAYTQRLETLAAKPYLTDAEKAQVDALDGKITALEKQYNALGKRTDIGIRAKTLEQQRLGGLLETERQARGKITGLDESRRGQERSEINEAIKNLRGERTPLESQMYGRKGRASESRSMADRPFRQAQPDLAAGLSGAGIAASAVMPYWARTAALGRANRFAKEWTGTVGKAEDAVVKGETNKARLFANQLKKYPQQAKAMDQPPSKIGKASLYGINAALPIETAMIPEQLDLAFGTEKAKESAWKNILDPRRIPAAAVTGAALTGISAKVPLLRATVNRPEARSKGAITSYNAMALEEKKAREAGKAAAAALLTPTPARKRGKAKSKKFAEGGEVGGLGNADEIANIQAALDELNQTTQREGLGLRYQRQTYPGRESTARPHVSAIERAGNQIEVLQDRLAALRGAMGTGQPVGGPTEPAEPPREQPIVDAPGRQRDYWDIAKKVMFGDPDAMVPGELMALNRPPSTWSPQEQDFIYGGTNAATSLGSPFAAPLRMGPALRSGLGAAPARPPARPGGLPPGTGPRAPVAPTEPPAAPGPWNPPPGSALGPAAGRAVRGTLIPVQRGSGGKYETLSGTRKARDPNRMPDRRLPGPGLVERAVGGPAQVPWYSRDEARHMTVGPLAGSGAGRTDRLPISVPSGSYVVPADIVSGLGQGNTANGLKAMQRMFTTGPYGMALPRMTRGRGIPRPPRPARFAVGGGVPIMAADGEYVVPPEKVIEIGNGDMDHGHDVLDHFVRLMRQDTIKTLSRLPPPQTET
jgi:hypothetical protein